MGQTTSDICYGVLQRVKEHHRFVTEWYKWSKKITGFLRNGTKGQTTSDVCYGVLQRVKQHQMFVTVWYKGSNNIKRFVTECVQRVKQRQKLVTEWYNGSNNIRYLLRSVTKGQGTSEVCYGVVQSGQTKSRSVVTAYVAKGQTTSEIIHGVLHWVNNIRDLFRSVTNDQTPS